MLSHLGSLYRIAMKTVIHRLQKNGLILNLVCLPLVMLPYIVAFLWHSEAHLHGFHRHLEVPLPPAPLPLLGGIWGPGKPHIASLVLRRLSGGQKNPTYDLQALEDFLKLGRLHMDSPLFRMPPGGAGGCRQLLLWLALGNTCVCRWWCPPSCVAPRALAPFLPSQYATGHMIPFITWTLIIWDRLYDCFREDSIAVRKKWCQNSSRSEKHLSGFWSAIECPAALQIMCFCSTMIGKAVG